MKSSAYEGRALRQADIGCLYLGDYLADERDHLAVERYRPHLGKPALKRQLEHLN
jgi:hypothetical protein